MSSATGLHWVITEPSNINTNISKYFWFSKIFKVLRTSTNVWGNHAPSHIWSLPLLNLAMERINYAHLIWFRRSFTGSTYTQSSSLNFTIFQWNKSSRVTKANFLCSWLLSYWYIEIQDGIPGIFMGGRRGAKSQVCSKCSKCSRGGNFPIPVLQGPALGPLAGSRGRKPPNLCQHVSKSHCDPCSIRSFLPEPR